MLHSAKSDLESHAKSASPDSDELGRGGRIKKGDTIINGLGTLVSVSEIEMLDESFEVFDITVDNPCHNYVANGLLCHNKVMAEKDDLR
jgi:hypothetical protein